MALEIIGKKNIKVIGNSNRPEGYLQEQDAQRCKKNLDSKPK